MCTREGNSGDDEGMTGKKLRSSRKYGATKIVREKIDLEWTEAPLSPSL